MEFYQAIAWMLFTFLAGMGITGYISLRLHRAIRTTGGAQAEQRRGFEWARRDVAVALPEPALRNTALRRITDWENAPWTDGRTISFHIQDRDGLERDLTFSGARILAFFKCDSPARSEYHGNHNDYSQLLGIGKHYAWLLPEGKGYTWAHFLSTRERRLRVLESWLNA